MKTQVSLKFMKTLFLLAGSIFVAGSLLAQSERSRPAGSSWKELENRSRGSGQGNVLDELSLANDPKQFYEQNPSGENADRARAHEALSLVRAWKAGDISQKTRRERTVAQVRSNRQLPVELPAEVAATADDTSLLSTVFAPAFVTIKHTMVHDDPSQPFAAHITANKPEEVDNDRGSPKIESDYWAVYVKNVFQADMDKDYDPNTERPILFGANQYMSTEKRHNGCLIFHETIRDYGFDEAVIVAHEIGHYFHPGLFHSTDDSLMAPGTNVVDLSFNKDSLARIRGFTHPPTPDRSQRP